MNEPNCKWISVEVEVHLSFWKNCKIIFSTKLTKIAVFCTIPPPELTRGIGSIDFHALEFHACSVAGHIWSCLTSHLSCLMTHDQLLVSPEHIMWSYLEFDISFQVSPVRSGHICNLTSVSRYPLQVLYGHIWNLTSVSRYPLQV